MKILQMLFIFNLLFYLLNCTCSSFYNNTISDYDEDEKKSIYIDNDASVTNCAKRNFSDIEKNYGNAYKCCYSQMKCTIKDDDDDTNNKLDIKSCSSISKALYDNLKNAENSFTSPNDNLKCTDVKLDCSGGSLSYLYSAFILLILF